MRTINAEALSEIQREFGLEPIVIVRVFWNDNPVDYSDKTDQAADVHGRVLDISGLDNVINIDGSSTSTSITVKLDDSDGVLRQIMNTTDIHKRKVQILQWFSGRPKSDAFILFTGQINTPIDWSEGERTLSFSVVNMVENLELGFSLEEGIFQQLPVTAYGKTFPVVFGTVFKVPALMLSESPSGILAQGFATINEDAYDAELDDIRKQKNLAFKMAQFLFQAGVGTNLIAATYNDGISSTGAISFPTLTTQASEIGGLGPQLILQRLNVGSDQNPPDDYGQYTSLRSAAEQYFSQSNDYMNQFRALGLQEAALVRDLAEKRRYVTNHVQIASINFPRGIPVIVEINNTRFHARFDGVGMTTGDIIEPPNEQPAQAWFINYTDDPVSRTYEVARTTEKFKWFDAGSTIRVISVPLYYVACYGLNSQILGVYARKNGIRVNIPTNLYTVTRSAFTNSAGVTAWGTIITVRQPLTTLYDQAGRQLYESDDIWCDIRGETGSQFIDIMLWTVTLFTNLQIDPVSWGLVRTQTINSPMNFAILDRKNTFDFIRDICYQARCAVWIDDRKVILRYLPATPTPVDTITPDDIVEDTLTITCNDTESLITKTIAEWKAQLDQEQPNKFIVRYNIPKYGVHQEDYDYFCYNQEELVRRAVAFWAVRKGNSWKRLTFKTFLHKLKLESHDPVLFSGFDGLFSNGDVTGIVESAIYDSATATIQFTVWLPIRNGEMDPYIFAYPANVTQLFGRGALEFQSGNPFDGVQDTSGIIHAAIGGFISVGPLPPSTSGAYAINDTPPTATLTTNVTQVSIDNLRPDGLLTANASKKTSLKEVQSFDVPDAPTGVGDFGTVLSADPDDNTMYNIQLIDTTTVVKAKQIRIRTGYRIPVNEIVQVVKKKGKWYMQSPIWMKEQDS